MKGLFIYCFMAVLVNTLIIIYVPPVTRVLSAFLLTEEYSARLLPPISQLIHFAWWAYVFLGYFLVTLAIACKKNLRLLCLHFLVWGLICEVLFLSLFWLASVLPVITPFFDRPMGR